MDAADTECSICLQQFVHPVELPCGHVFCFLCIKGCAQHRRRCPMCRGRFSVRFFEDPKLVNVSKSRFSVEKPEEAVNSVPADLVYALSEDGPNEPVASQAPCVSTQSVLPSSDYRWFYEGFAGWWQYDDRTSDELESAFSKQLNSCDVQVAGFIYTIDFVNMTQKRQDNSGRKRRIKRDLKDCAKKGIAGIKLSSLTDRNVTIANRNSAASGISRQPQTNDSCVNPSEPVQHTASSSSCLIAQEPRMSQTCSLSHVPANSSDSVYTHSNLCPTQPVRHTLRARAERSRTVAVSDRNASRVRQSPSPTPIAPRDIQNNPSNNCTRLPGSRNSRSVPRRR